MNGFEHALESFFGAPYGAGLITGILLMLIIDHYRKR
jgi:hypothetical protein